MGKETQKVASAKAQNAELLDETLTTDSDLVVAAKAFSNALKEFDNGMSDDAAQALHDAVKGLLG